MVKNWKEQLTDQRGVPPLKRDLGRLAKWPSRNLMKTVMGMGVDVG